MIVVEDHSKMDDLRDQFPVGMRVLAVDDDRTCLKILETLLQRCQYHVTTAKNAITALKLLRGNKKKFDLVISDVHMPDMDGFKLLELVGLEMDLPVIMLSANDDPKMVMKGISHGACDYLLKPVRIKELQIIWQHVIRRKKTNKTGNQDMPNSDSCNELDSAVTANSNQNEKPSKKRKDQDEDDVEENENDHDNEDPTAQKKPRVVWSVELHRKFVAAVNQLGVDKAVPKKILDLMNVEKLTRENVASHLQKYRLYLKRISCVANQQANMVAALGSADQSYLRLQTLNGSRQFQNNAFRSFPSGGMSSRLNIPPSVNVHGLPSSGTLQLCQTQNTNNSTNDQLKFQLSAIARGNQNGVPGMPISIGPDQLQHNRGINPIQSLTSNLPNYKPKVTMSCTPSPVLDISNNASMLEPKLRGAYKSLASHHSQFSPSLLDTGRCNDRWSNNMTSGPLQDGILSGSSYITPLSSQHHDSLTDINSQGVINNMSCQGWINHNQYGNDNSHVIGSSVGSLIPLNAAEPEGTLDFGFCEPLQMNQLKSQNSGISNNFGSLEDMVSAMMKQKQQDRVKLLDGYLYDNYSGGTSL